MKDFWVGKKRITIGARTTIEAAIDEAEAPFLRKRGTLFSNKAEPRFCLVAA
jgi:hypothetical protein